MRLAAFVFAAALAAATTVRADDARAVPRPVPLTRPEMKQLLEDMKGRTPRIPLPEATAAEKAELGERMGYEGRLRQLYLSFDPRRTGGAPGAPGTPANAGGANRGGGRGEFGRDPDPKMTLDYKFKTMLFWVVSRTNNCQYCMGHQESKLLGAGMSEDEIAALDGDWDRFSPAEQAALAMARKITLAPHEFGDADIDGLRPHFTDLQILEMLLSVGGNNQINRWKEGVGVPQGANGGGFSMRGPDGAPADPSKPSGSYLTPTSEQNQKKLTKVAAVAFAPNGEPTRQTICARPPLESPAEVEAALAACRQRAPRLPLVDEAQARTVLGDDAPEGPLPQWIRLLANFPREGKSRIVNVLNSERKGDLSPLMKAQLAWIIARQDRAWYATGRAKQQLAAQGWTDAQIYSLDGSWEKFSPAERALFTVGRKLAASPVVLTDNEVAQAVRLAGPRDVVQVVNFTTNRALYDRLTEAAGLQLED